MKTENRHNQPRPPHTPAKPEPAKVKRGGSTRPKLGSRDLREDRGTRQIKNSR